MSMIKQLDRLRRMHTLIKFRRTGTPEDFAERLGISQSLLFRLLNELKNLGAPIAYCHLRRSYTYLYCVELQLGFAAVPDNVPPDRPLEAPGAKVRSLHPPRPSEVTAMRR
ncbi:hypothetical protein [Neolewinella litorea]|uniref:HTH domain-containing protein n=1 Tax=Neolewinella litorea TaxID=2562452 RepID=A0A4S4NS76_9BACT|nr:hypothetical protein [Neolewinella litorea]THH42077.1 hypothetical protein E4021_05710 [Neolewinella litorea]